MINTEIQVIMIVSEILKISMIDSTCVLYNVFSGVSRGYNSLVYGCKP